MTSTNTTARYYDHSKNTTNAAVAHAMAKAAREVKAEGTAWTVNFTSRNGERNFWSGCAHDALALAKQLVNNGMDATLVAPNGTVRNAAGIKAARF